MREILEEFISQRTKMVQEINEERKNDERFQPEEYVLDDVDKFIYRSNDIQ